MIYFDYYNPETYNNYIPLGLVPNTEFNIEKFKEQGQKINNRTFVVLEDIQCRLSNDQIIVIPKDFTTDLMSIPGFLWSMLRPFDSAFLGDLIHDFLYDDKMAQIKLFNSNIYKAQKFADEERHKWRTQITKQIPRNKLRFKNWITNFFLKLVGMNFYTKKFQIPD